MTHQGDGDSPQSRRRGYVPRSFRSLVEERKRKPKAAEPDTNGESSENHPLVRETARLASVTRQLAIWTRVLAGAAILAFFASLLQWDAMRGQLHEMQTAATQADNAIAATNRLADEMLHNVLESHRLADEASKTASAAAESITETRRLVDQAKRSADAAAAMADTTNKGNILQQKEMSGRILMTLDKSLAPGGWAVSSNFVNTGKTEVRGFLGWDDFKIFSNETEASAFDFDNPSTEHRGNYPSRVVNIAPQDGKTFFTKFITLQDAESIMNGKVPVLWGYIEYNDIFKGHYTSRFRFTFNFRRDKQRINMNLPNYFGGGCNRDTYPDSKTTKGQQPSR